MCHFGFSSEAILCWDDRREKNCIIFFLVWETRKLYLFFWSTVEFLAFCFHTGRRLASTSCNSPLLAPPTILILLPCSLDIEISVHKNNPLSESLGSGNWNPCHAGKMWKGSLLKDRKLCVQLFFNTKGMNNRGKAFSVCPASKQII